MPRRIDEDIAKLDAEVAAMEAEVVAAVGDPSPDDTPDPAPDLTPEPEPVAAPVPAPTPTPVEPPKPGALSRLSKGDTAPPTPTEPKPAVGDVDYRHKYDSEVPKLHTWVRERDERIEQLEQRAKVAERKAAELEARASTLTPEEFMDRYGLDEDGLDSLGGYETSNKFRHVAGRVADEQLRPVSDKVAALDLKLANITNELVRVRSQRFVDRTSQAHPELNSPEFGDWLEQMPHRADQFRASMAAEDVESLLGDYARFQAVHGNGAGSPPSLASQAMPSNSATPSALVADQQPKQYTVDDLNKLLNRWNHDWGRMSPEQRSQLSAEIDAAELSVVMAQG